MATKTWTATSSTWATAAHWAEGAIPTTGDDLSFPAGSAAVTTGATASVTVGTVSIRSNQKVILTNVTYSVLDAVYTALPTGGVFIVGGTYSNATGGATSNSIALSGINVGSTPTFEIASGSSFTNGLTLTATNCTCNSSNATHVWVRNCTVGGNVNISTVSGSYGNLHRWFNSCTINAGSTVTTTAGGTWSPGWLPSFDATTATNATINLNSGSDFTGTSLSGCVVNCAGDNVFTSGSLGTNTLAGATINANGTNVGIFAAPRPITTDAGTTFNVGSNAYQWAIGGGVSIPNGTRPTLTIPAAGNVVTGSGTFGWSDDLKTPSYPTTATSKAEQLAEDQAAVVADKRMNTTTLGGVAGNILATDVTRDTDSGRAAGGTRPSGGATRLSIGV